MTDAYSATAERLLFTLHHRLDIACAERKRVPVGASALLQRAIDEMRADGVAADEVRRAETVAVALHQLEWLQQAGDADTADELARLRDAVRLLLTAPTEAGLPEATHPGTLFDWHKLSISEVFVQPTVWLSRMRRQRLTFA